MFQGKRAGWQRIVLVVAAVGTLVSFALILGGEWGPSVGLAGLLSRLGFAAGFFAFAVAIGCFFVVFAVDLRRTRRVEAREGRLDRWLWLRELGVIALNILVYGGAFILAMGGLSSLDGAGAGQVATVAAAWVLCVVGVVLYRRHRKRRRVAYDEAGPVLLTAFLAALCALGLFVGVDAGGGALVDLVRGPQVELCALVDVREDKPSGRYRALSPTVLACEFVTASGESVRVDVAQQDATALQSTVDAAQAGKAVLVTYYPHSRTLVSAEAAG